MRKIKGFVIKTKEDKQIENYYKKKAEKKEKQMQEYITQRGDIFEYLNVERLQ